MKRQLEMLLCGECFSFFVQICIFFIYYTHFEKCNLNYVYVITHIQSLRCTEESESRHFHFFFKLTKLFKCQKFIVASLNSRHCRGWAKLRVRYTTCIFYARGTSAPIPRLIRTTCRPIYTYNYIYIYIYYVLLFYVT